MRGQDLYVAAKGGDVEGVRTLLAQGVDNLDWKDSVGTGHALLSRSRVVSSRRWVCACACGGQTGLISLHLRAAQHAWFL